MKKTIRLTESDINRIVRKVLNEQITGSDPMAKIMECLSTSGIDLKMPPACKSFIDALQKGGEPDMMQAGMCGMAIMSKGADAPKVFQCIYGAFGQKAPQNIITKLASR
jgi:hypothetical protein